MTERLRVMLATEGTYPFHQGGVSTWCHLLLEKLPDVDYTVYSITMNPYVTQKYSLPPGSRLIRVPLWGTEEPSEHLDIPFSQTYANKQHTGTDIIEREFLPLLQVVTDEIIRPTKDPQRLGQVLLSLYRYFQRFDYRDSFLSEAAYESFKGQIIAACQDPACRLSEPSVFDINQSLGWLYRFLVTLNTPIPRVDVSHSTAAAFCGIPCVLAKQLYGTPFLLTEHGVYLREQYLSLSRRGQSAYLNTFLIRLIHSVSALAYAYADQVSPVCQYNTRWERQFGVEAARIRVIYNGVDPTLYAPAKGPVTRQRPTVVSVARVDPVKDQVTLLKAAALVKERITDVRFVVYGSVSVPDYYQECIQLRDMMGLTEAFEFAGHVSDTPRAYQAGDVIALSSVTEGFPYSVVEAMMSGKAIVATDVGGVSEAVADCGLVVPPRDHHAMAEALIRLLTDAELRSSLGSEARERALNYFTIDQSLGAYMASYRRMAAQAQNATAAYSLPLVRQQTHAERGYAFMQLGLWQEAIGQFRQAINANTSSPAVPILLFEVSQALERLGQGELAALELEKAETVAAIQQRTA